jgi:DNA-binding MarR family transcriptional regulator
MTARRRARGAPGSTEPTERLRILFRDIFFKARSISSRRLGHFGLTPTQFLALRALMRDDGASVGTLAGEVGVPPSSMSRILDQLEKGRYLRRAVGRADRRRVRVFLRPKGRKLRDKVRTFWTGMGREMFRDLSASDREMLEARLAHIYENLMRVERMESES